MEITAREFKTYLKNVITMVESEKDYLCELDRKIGDGDHGITMSIGFQAVRENLDHELAEETDCSKISISVGKTFLNAVGSSVGPLYATGFMRGAKQIKKKEVLNDQDVIAFWIAFGNGVKERGRAEIGDKTMVDTFAPFVDALEANGKGAEDLSTIFREAVTKAEEGMHSTKKLISKKGRSSRLGDRSIGAQDPGATSAYFLLVTFLALIEDLTQKAG
ncbi:dihydroxyacetone kinase subunit DhaL [Lentibacillus salicampi]|uniref:phosphoenolpyruvate--glycerone phosphotransferase n=1 Tax=Lentibacillus salicampi TaxID=175306 RepID=A0A4Y9A914_9BACI|nr:dihydroxyacetone kinase subunit DhaL [Lentibacillus salicampi]TFJ92346.1 dihydroxyacetone kinase subunit L [Lentibacillus salicampi]